MLFPLNMIEGKILSLHKKGLTLTEIGEKFTPKKSRERVRQILAKAVEKERISNNTTYKKVYKEISSEVEFKTSVEIYGLILEMLSDFRRKYEMSNEEEKILEIFCGQIFKKIIKEYGHKKNPYQYLKNN